MVAPRSIDASSTTLEELLSRVQSEHLPLQITRDGRPVAELRPIGEPVMNGEWRLREVDVALRPQIAREDAMAPLDETDWPAENRP